MSIVLHHLETSRSHRILWLLEELGLDYEIKTYQRTKAGRAPEALRAVHPLGRAPVVVADGTVLYESGAVIEGLLDRYGKGRLRPEGSADFRFWLHYAEGSLMPPLLVKLLCERVRNAPLPFFLKPIGRTIAGKVNGAYTDPELANHLSFVEGQLAGKTWLLGDDFSAADIQMSYPIEAADSRIGFDSYPNLAGYLKRLRARPAYQVAVDKGGPPIP